VEHDVAYWIGGTREERSRADRELKVCVEEIESASLARTMWLGVRAGGSPYVPTSYRWGYGWPFTRGYQEVSDEEAQHARSLRAPELDPQRTAALEVE